MCQRVRFQVTWHLKWFDEGGNSPLVDMKADDEEQYASDRTHVSKNF